MISKPDEIQTLINGDVLEDINDLLCQFTGFFIKRVQRGVVIMDSDWTIPPGYLLIPADAQQTPLSFKAQTDLSTQQVAL